MIAIGKNPLPDLSAWIFAEKLISTPDGFVIAVKPDGRVWSRQPGGFWEDRDPGSVGAYEKASVLPQGLCYNARAPNDPSHRVEVFALIPKVPNA